MHRGGCGRAPERLWRFDSDSGPTTARSDSVLFRTQPAPRQGLQLSSLSRGVVNRVRKLGMWGGRHQCCVSCRRDLPSTMGLTPESYKEGRRRVSSKPQPTASSLYSLSYTPPPTHHTAITMTAKEQIPKTQRAAVSDDKSGFKIKDIPVVQPDELEAGRALVKVLYSGVCHVSRSPAVLLFSSSRFRPTFTSSRTSGRFTPSAPALPATRAPVSLSP